VVGFSAHSTGLMASWPEEVSIGNMAFALSAVSTVDTGSTHYWTYTAPLVTLTSQGHMGLRCLTCPATMFVQLLCELCRY
jgi:hypothetical protein